MKVLVTGAAGFIGMHVARRLLERGDEVVGIDNLNDYYDPRLKLARLENLQPHPLFRFTRMDIADTAALAALFAEEGFERDLQYVRRLMEEEYTAPVKILELNANHPIVGSLAALTERNGDDPRINDGIEQLLDNLLLMEGTFTGSVADLVDRVQRLMKVGLEK